MGMCTSDVGVFALLIMVCLACLIACLFGAGINGLVLVTASSVVFSIMHVLAVIAWLSVCGFKGAGVVLTVTGIPILLSMLYVLLRDVCN